MNASKKSDVAAMFFLVMVIPTLLLGIALHLIIELSFSSYLLAVAAVTICRMAFDFFKSKFFRESEQSE